MAQCWRDRSVESKRRHIARHREYLKENPDVADRVRQHQRRRYAEDPEYRARRAESRDRFRKNNPVGQAWCGCRGGAKERNLPFELPRELFNDLVTDNCFYCGEPPNPVNGIDRVNNLLGYIEGNVVTCCRICNESKRARTREEFEAWAIRIARRAL